MKIAIYDTIGKILQVGLFIDQAHVDLQNFASPYITVDESVDLTDKYVLNGALTQRPAQTTQVDKTTLTANGIDKVTITNAPANAVMEVNGQTASCANPDYFSTEIAGTYELTVSVWPYIDFKTTITAI